jgi:hypothetical protein
MAAKKTSRRRSPKTKPSALSIAGGRADQLDVGALRLDEKNPRLPEEEQSGTQDDLLRFIATEYSPMEIARSIATHGFFISEPLIVIKDNDEYIVVEGNRRLAALQLLADPSKAVELELDDAADWMSISKSVALPTQIPVVVAPSRKAVAPIVGYRHISGIEPWDPYAKARFVAGLVDSEKRTFPDTAALVGETQSAVRSYYRNFRIAKQSKDKFSFDVTRARKRFGVFTRALQDENIREFIKAPAAADVEAHKDPLPKSAKKPIEEFLSWVFGDDHSKPVLSDSRKLKDLGVAVSTPDGLKALRETRDLAAAFAAAGGPERRVIDQLTHIRAAMQAAQDGIAQFAANPSVKNLVLSIDTLSKEFVDSVQ